MKRTIRLLGSFYVAVSIFVILLVLIFTIVSAIPWKFTYLEIGKLVGPFPGLEFLVLILLVLPITVVSLRVSMKLKKNKIICMFFLGLGMSFLVISSFALVFMPKVSDAGKKIDLFINENAHLNFQDYVSKVSAFLDENVRSAYNKPEASFKIDNDISVTLLDPFIMKAWGLTRADLIVYQGWGSCGQAAILIEQLLYEVGYETRRAHFKNIDHAWAEVKFNGEWLIIDPWYIGNFVQIQNLKSVRPEFLQASGVEVLCLNGTIVDASHEHGY
ncbi:MAG: transglutaminase domain-containing protein [Candidatus Bathyarchaeia archaeon]